MLPGSIVPGHAVVLHEPVALHVVHADAVTSAQSGSTLPQPQSQPSPVPYFVTSHVHCGGTVHVELSVASMLPGHAVLHEPGSSHQLHAAAVPSAHAGSGAPQPQSQSVSK